MLKIIKSFFSLSIQCCSFVYSFRHSQPYVTCLESGFVNSYIHADGAVVHRDLQENWSAVYTLVDVIQILEYVRRKSVVLY